MAKLDAPRSGGRPGSVMLCVLAGTLVTSLIIVGVMAVTTSHYKLVRSEADYQASLTAAEAGINYELNVISSNSANADAAGTGGTGVAHTTTAGTFNTWCTQMNSNGSDSGSSWTPPNNLYIHATATTGTSTRSIKVGAKGYSNGGTATYAVYGVNTSIIDNTPTFVNGDVGTNHQFTFNNLPTINGNVIFNGPGAGWQSTPSRSYNVVYNSAAVVWPTVENLAIAAFGSTGLTYVASHNDNATASPTISSPNLLINSGTQTFVGKAGGANYYLTSLTCNGSSTVYFDNTHGPITIWVGPSGSSGTWVFSGGTAAIKASADSTKPVRIYLATTNDVQLNGSSEFDAGVYNVNNSNSGRVLFNGSPAIYGCVIANSFIFNQAPTVHYVSGYFVTGAINYYGTITSYQEINPVD